MTVETTAWLLCERQAVTGWCGRAPISDSARFSAPLIARRGSWMRTLLVCFVSLNLIGCADWDSRAATDTSDPDASASRVSLPEARVPAIRPATSTAELALAALATSDRQSPTIGLVAQRVAEREAIGRGRWPQISPVAEIDDEGNRNLGANASLTVLDFGRTRSLRARADAEVSLARIDLWEERTDNVLGALVEVIRAVEAQSLGVATNASLEEITTLRDLAMARLGAGVSDEAESILFDLRLAELRNEAQADASLLRLALGQVSAATDLTVDMGDLPSLSAIEAALSVQPESSNPPALARAALEFQQAERSLELELSRRFPRLLLRGSLLYAASSVSPGVSVALDSSDFPGFSGRPVLEAARSALISAEANVVRTQRDLVTELQRIDLERARLLSRIRSLERLEAEARRSAEVFVDQQSIGGRPLTDGITVYRTLLQAERDLISTRAEILRLQMRRAALEGALVAWGDAQ
ncbi:TolC family protein [Roseobacter sp. HKCCD8767]|uniref:TolC family protein n=7 Tax=Roseobacter TaxID=2433 RepID=UPI001491FCDA|nr:MULTISPECIES: TolC family protein [unclassified Roseobacter]NNV99627.1 TolC family protein [Roseobacter sp. HKCCD6505]NNX53425.1 TolC family protein [Roseobacter sp. HKCCD9024]NNY98347.1 TolC family protein [Roseobacter sp. HKCCD9052]NOA17767.1 TolC family protein [Roseobacter sp. HKCCD6507]NOC13808.1 TolC family protein [Roseobacter sp. HKCCD8309]